MSIKPYHGKDGYVFISYSHADAQQVFPVIEALQGRGYRVWFDEGIDPGTEWDENIAAHIQSCHSLLAFVSEHYIASENCKDELNYARDLNKQRLLIYLDDVLLPPGMAMRFNRLQSIFMYKYPDEAGFYEKLFSTEQLTGCKNDVPGDASADRSTDGGADRGQQKEAPAAAAEPASLPRDADGTSDAVRPSAEKEPTNDGGAAQRNTEAPGDPYAFIGPLIASFLQKCGGADKKTLTNGIGKTKLMKTLGIPDGAEVYLAHDDTLLHNGGNGFAMWSEGISARPLWSETDLVLWSELIGSDGEIAFSPETGVCRLVSDYGTKKAVLYLSGSHSLREALIDLIREIRKKAPRG